jgi:hypothetical protein
MNMLSHGEARKSSVMAGMCDKSAGAGTKVDKMPRRFAVAL